LASRFVPLDSALMIGQYFVPLAELFDDFFKIMNIFILHST